MEIYMLNNDGGIKFTPNYNTEQHVRDTCTHDGSSRWKTQVLTVLRSLLAIVFLFFIENNVWAQCVVGPFDQVIEPPGIITQSYRVIHRDGSFTRKVEYKPMVYIKRCEEGSGASRFCIWDHEAYIKREVFKSNGERLVRMRRRIVIVPLIQHRPNLPETLRTGGSTHNCQAQRENAESVDKQMRQKVRDALFEEIEEDKDLIERAEKRNYSSGSVEVRWYD